MFIACYDVSLPLLANSYQTMMLVFVSQVRIIFCERLAKCLFVRTQRAMAPKKNAGKTNGTESDGGKDVENLQLAVGVYAIYRIECEFNKRNLS